MSNRLAQEKSPYLLQHAQNPVDWFPWGEEAFAKARKENKPIFLSVGYSTCHWCHVMEHESFEIAATAEVMNQYFVNVKVDREERPDVDQLYMTYVQATSGHGGWPMNVWLTPDLKPFFGGTYFPPQENYGRPSFVTVLKTVGDAWRREPEKISAHSTGVLNNLKNHSLSAPAYSGLKLEWTNQTWARLSSSFDPVHGGFGSAPKFPRPSVLNFLFNYAHSTTTPAATEQACFTLRQMAQGGLRDHVGGGFHRYSVDARWHVPHFEKMLYDQAQLILSYLDAYQLTKDPFYSEVAEQTLTYCLRDLLSPNGGFYSAEDADSLPSHDAVKKLEGAFYVWTREELETILGKELLTVFEKEIEIGQTGNVPSAIDPHGELTGTNVLIYYPLGKNSTELESCFQKLFTKRQLRPRPHLDDKIITAWNGLMLSALARAWAVLRQPIYLEKAHALVRFLRQHLFNSNTSELIRSYREGPSSIGGFSEDYAFLIRGLLDLYEATGEEEHLIWADQLQTKQNDLFLDPDAGGFYRATSSDPSILIRLKDDYDGAEPSANSISALNLVRLSDMTENSNFRVEAGKLLRLFSEHLAESGTSVPQLQVALMAYLNPPTQIIITGDSQNLLYEKFQQTVGKHYLSNHRILYVPPLEKGHSFLADKVSLLAALRQKIKDPEAYVCRDFSCQLPATTPEALDKLIS